MEVVIDIKYNDEEKSMDIELSGNEMGVLIGKRGQTLDSLQYLVSLVVNKESEEYIHCLLYTSCRLLSSSDNTSSSNRTGVSFVILFTNSISDNFKERAAVRLSLIPI